ncbi:DUF4865 family protein [Streptomyces spectabilis]|uniref:DUF4865 family protein n=1 Tax=Streptomyces spectabilis TaxID=68270 RepID=A0A5P2XMM7_STRST|nr:DUF4865 family protein [Streptomyces spectabilis]MBB5101952.1 hypothetical protein [Streptomyces spectabilis]MCI3907004.1 DUF4865 family protein [Streptomyces spectabilis]QEV63786.1 DUF4865 family protein [Streptomyces spectabilis]GGV35306.1 DUF4865 domain-containing protein [Streptomyces spectabilis]
MHALQYEITLPADYDMGVIRDRVAAKGHLLDEFPGLGFKAYLMRERGVDGSPVNQYAPFYLWNTAEGMNSFLWGPGFQGLTDDFGRPVVQHWMALAHEAGSAVDATPKAAVRHRTPLPEGARIADLTTGLLDDAATLSHADGAIGVVVAVDPRHWEAVTFSLWAHEAPEERGEVFQVLHCSTPERDLLVPGRAW